MLIYCHRFLAVKPNYTKGDEEMTDREAFMNVVNLYGKKIYEVAAGMGMSPQTLYNKIGNVSEFTTSEIAKFRAMFPEVTDESFNKIFFAEGLAVKPNE